MPATLRTPSGSLSRYVTAAGFKRLTSVEIDKERSNQHEFQGVSRFREILGTDQPRKEFATTFIFLSDDDDHRIITAEGSLTWYDSRARQRAKRRPEWHLYYSRNKALDLAAPGDLLVIALRPNEKLLACVSPKGSRAEIQLVDLFGFDERQGKPSIRKFALDNKELDATSSLLLTRLGVVRNAG